MSEPIKGNQRYLTNSDRVYIDQSLAEGQNFSKIAKFIVKDESTVSKGVRKYKTLHPYYKGKINDCMKFNRCRNKNMCSEEYCYAQCTSCRKVDCRNTCKDYESNNCEKLKKPPYVCNGGHDR